MSSSVSNGYLVLLGCVEPGAKGWACHTNACRNHPCEETFGGSRPLTRGPRLIPLAWFLWLSPSSREAAQLSKVDIHTNNTTAAMGQDDNVTAICLILKTLATYLCVSSLFFSTNAQHPATNHMPRASTPSSIATAAPINVLKKLTTSFDIQPKPSFSCNVAPIKLSIMVATNAAIVATTTP